MDKIKKLSSNSLKLIGCFAMLLDHIGLIFFPDVEILRIIGRIAYPIFCFALVEGCFYTKNRLKHFLLIFLMAIIIQIVYYVVIKDMSLSIFMVFSISIILIYLYDLIVKEIIKTKSEEKTKKDYLILILSVLAFLSIVTLVVIGDIYTTYLRASYGYHGVLIPVILYIVLVNTKHNLLITILTLMILLIILPFMRGEYYNFYSLIAIPLLLLYNGKLGKYKLKYFFYLFYPLHLALLYLIYIIIN